MIKKKSSKQWREIDHAGWLKWKREYYKKNHTKILKQTRKYWNRPENIDRKREHVRKSQQKIIKKAKAYDRLKAKGLI